MKTLHELIQFHAQEAERANSQRKRQQHRTMQILLEAFQLDTKIKEAKTWLKQSAR